MIKPIVTIYRVEDDFVHGVFGVMLFHGEVLCWTLEPHEFENQKSVSCIPPGIYECEPVESPTFGHTYEVKNVPLRSHILFHAGNVVENTRGCILLGSRIGKLKGDRAVLNSGDTLRRFLKKADKYGEFRLHIKEAWA